MDGTELDEETIAGLNAFYAQTARQVPDYNMGVTKGGDRVVTHIGIGFRTADQNALVNSGMVSGSDQGNMTDGRISLSAAISEFEKAGMTCTITPVYKTAE